MAFGADDAALIGAAASVIGAGTSAVAQSSLNKKTREFNKEEAEKQRLWSEKMYNAQNAWNYEMWQKQNEYNSPESQIQRMRDAGLNPLYYGLDGSSAGDLSAAQPLGYERATVGNQVNPLGSFQDAAIKAAQVTAMQLQNEKLKKELSYTDDMYNAEIQIKNATVDEIRQNIEESKNRIANGEMDIKLKNMDIDKKQAEIANEWAKYASIGLDNKLKEQLNPLLVRAQELENDLAETHNKYEEQRILAELAETKAHVAAMYASAALDGARKEGVDLENKIKGEEAKYAANNAKNRANLLRWTAYSQREKLRQEQYNTENSKYYSEHYEEAFRNSWSKSGVEYGLSEKLAQSLGTFAVLGMMLAY